MKFHRSIVATLCIALVALSGCAAEKSENTVANSYMDFGDEVIQAVETELPQDTILMLWDGTDSISAYTNDGSVRASVRVGKAEYIPEFAEVFCPIITRLADENDYEIGYIDICSYNEAMDDGSLVNWNTHNGITGTFLVDGDDIIKTGADIEYIASYYGNIAEIEDASLQYQGEWQCQEREGKRLFGSGTSINFVSDSEIGDKSFRHITTFELGYDEDGDIVVCGDVGNPCYEIFIENDVLYITNISSGAVETYVKISDNTDTPEEKVAPSIGMTEDEVLSSTWGSPIKRNKTTTSSHEREQWVYDDGYIYFTDGIVTSIQEN